MSFADQRALTPRRGALAPADARRVTRPFASVECFADPAQARAAWLELEPAGGAYQTLRFAQAWRAAFGARLALIVARDAAGVAVALLPLRLRRVGPLTSAGFVGDSWANYHMGLFRPGLVWSEDDVAALLRAAGRAAGVDLFAFFNVPAACGGGDNPLWALPGRASPNAAFASALTGTHAEWLDAHFSRATQKKLRKKARKLEVFGEVAHVRATDERQAGRFLDALLAHKAAQARGRGAADPFAQADVRRLLRGLIAGEAMEMHALLAGDRVIAVFGALPQGRRLSGLVVSYDNAPETAAATPGELMLIEVVGDAIARGFESFDLGVGESRYKNEMCEIEEPLRDCAFGVTALGRLAAPAFLAARGVRGWIKRQPRLMRLVRRLRKI